ncbi:MAG: hypothetical protein HC849_32465 [Oscillatoriales cyanobacterium RU_3_3]|nr:hypothetical protein [Oscillatoriales cyanobacterium RU_3_3]
MSNREQNPSPPQHESRNTNQDEDDCDATFLFSFGTSFCVCLVTAILFNSYMGGRGYGLDAGLGVLSIFIFYFPIISVLAFIIWIKIGRKGRDFKNAFASWFTALMVGLGTGCIIISIASNGLTTDSYRAFSNNQSLIGWGFPFFSLVTYAIVLAKLPRRQ